MIYLIAIFALCSHGFSLTALEPDSSPVPVKTHMVGANFDVDSDSSRRPQSLRMWTDSTGKFTLSARFISLVDGKVTLRTQERQLFEIDLNRLSDKDRQFLTKNFIDCINQVYQTSMASLSCLLTQRDKLPIVHVRTSNDRQRYTSILSHLANEEFGDPGSGEQLDEPVPQEEMQLELASLVESLRVEMENESQENGESEYLNHLRLRYVVTQTERVVKMLRAKTSNDSTFERRALIEAQEVFATINSAMLSAEDSRVYVTAQALTNVAMLELLGQANASALPIHHASDCISNSLCLPPSCTAIHNRPCVRHRCRLFQRLFRR